MTAKDIINSLKPFNKYQLKDIKTGMQIQMHNGFEAVHCEVMRFDPKNTGKFIGKLTTFFVKDMQGLKKGDLIIANVTHIDLIYK